MITKIRANVPDAQQLDYLTPSCVLEKIRKGSTNIITEVMRFYNFIGVVDRMEESLVTLQMLLNLSAKDILVLEAKNSMDRKRNPTLIPHNHISKTVDDFLTGKFFNGHPMDFELYNSVNLALNKTIESLPVDEFSRNLQVHRMLRKRVQSLPETRNKECYWGDNGCGYLCNDSLKL